MPAPGATSRQLIQLGQLDLRVRGAVLSGVLLLLTAAALFVVSQALRHPADDVGEKGTCHPQQGSCVPVCRTGSPPDCAARWELRFDATMQPADGSPATRCSLIQQVWETGAGAAGPGSGVALRGPELDCHRALQLHPAVTSCVRYQHQQGAVTCYTPQSDVLLADDVGRRPWKETLLASLVCLAVAILCILMSLSRGTKDPQRRLREQDSAPAETEMEITRLSAERGAQESGSV
eukprot:TRINITY_DN30698_c0_g1_i1.p1 TRINITY_DN30698_c0_g1~~TRINITY_DN30698_c0_g1_i1.p1  ORF type:complete len:251 (+),score=69.83 TRINITY_DN30698_c0_g1_i1:50-754(+)